MATGPRSNDRAEEVGMIPGDASSRRARRVAFPSFACLVLACSPGESTVPEPLAGARATIESRARSFATADRIAAIDDAVARFHPEVLAARAEFDAAVARAPAADSAWTTHLSLAAESEDGANETTGSIALDVLGIVGLGRLPCAALVARAEVMFAEASLVAELARATARTRGLVARRIRLHEERSRVATILEECEPTLRRSEILAASGFAPPGLASEAESSRAAIERRLAAIDRATAAVAAELRIATGGAFDPTELGIAGPALSSPPDSAVGPDLPALREELTRLALAEAKLRLEVSGRWPVVKLGPTFRLAPSTAFTGGMLELELADPRQVGAAVEAARIARDLADERLASAMLAIDAALEDGRAAERAAHAELAAAERAASNARDAERAARDRYLADPDAASEWHRMLGERLESVVAEFESRSDLDETTVELAIALGVVEPRP